MKHGFSIAAATVSLACATTPVWAGDIAQITQSGSANNVSIDQVVTPGNNTAFVRQGSDWQDTAYNNVQLLQDAVDSSTIDVTQSGYNNQYRVSQQNGSGLRATINAEAGYYGGPYSEGNTINIDQSGIGSSAQVEQSGYLNRADIVQQGWVSSNFATIYQTGDGSQATIAQSGYSGWGYGGGNQATIRQTR